jgi:hypothetical protein
MQHGGKKFSKRIQKRNKQNIPVNPKLFVYLYLVTETSAYQIPLFL